MKSIAPITPYGYTIFCDDVRQEIGNKNSLVGVYKDKLILNTPLPTSLSKFCFVIYYFERPDESTEPVHLRVYMPGDPEDTPTITAELPIDNARSKAPEPETPESDPLIGVISKLMIVPFKLTSEGRIRVRAYRGDLEVRLGTLTVVSMPVEDITPKKAPPSTRKSQPKKNTTRKRARSKKSV